jgi:hypothetical protein
VNWHINQGGNLHEFMGKFGREIKELSYHKFLEKRDNRQARFFMQSYNIKYCDSCTLYGFLSIEIKDFFSTHFKVVCGHRKRDKFIFCIFEDDY